MVSRCVDEIALINHEVLYIARIVQFTSILMKRILWGYLDTYEQ